MAIADQSSKKDPIRQTDAWNRQRWMWTILNAVGFIGPLIVVWIDPDFVRHAPWMSGVVAVILLLHFIFEYWYMPPLRSDTGERPQNVWIVLYVVTIIALWFVLTLNAPIYMFSLMSIFPMVFWVLEMRSAIPVVVAFVGLIMFLQFGGIEGIRSLGFLTMIALYLPFVIAVSVVGKWIGMIIQQSGERRELIEQLEQTQLELAQAERSRGILQERQRLAREIHDTLAQGFTSIVMNLEATEQAAPDLSATAEKHLSRARQTARDSLEQARRVVADLRPQPLDEYAFSEAFERVVAHWSDSAEITAKSTVTGDPQPLSPQAEVTLLRVIQETLGNIHKHAKAKNVNATLSYMDDVVVIDMQDDGIGLANSRRDGIDSAENNLSSGYGLIAMRERVEQLKGSLMIESSPGLGTTVVAEIPI